ncbi:MAG TPA: TIR domain-containing protein [Tepidisphaeraceae bacterium]|jgi:small GTP-binding protein|nr:TIR domain-containing protein [Tepidisphaeraceae bacterium]
MADKFQWDVFVSHSSHDKPKAKKLAEHLRGAGLSVWFDEWIVTPGTDIYGAVEKGLEQSRTLVLCMSDAAFGSDWVSLERGTAIFRDPQNRRRRFVPVLLEACEIPDTIRRFLYFDWRLDTTENLRALVQACRGNEANIPDEARRAQPEYELKGHKRLITCIALHPNRRFAITGSLDATLRVWNLTTKSHWRTYEQDAPIRACFYTPNGSIIAATAKNIFTIDDEGKRLTTVLTEGALQSLVVSFDGRMMAGLYEDGRVECRRTEIKHAHPKFGNEISGTFSGLVLHPYKTLMYSYSRNVIYTLDYNTGAILETRKHQKSDYGCIAISSDGKQLIAGTSAGTIELFRIMPNECPSHVATYEGHLGPLDDIRFNATGTHAVSSSSDWETRVWTIPSGECCEIFPNSLAPAAVTLDSEYVLTPTTKCDLAMWALKPISIGQIARPKVEKRQRYARYTNAKVVLVGEAGVGKSGIANRLSTDNYAETDSTHGMSVSRLMLGSSSHDLEQEVWLWDLAGQADYRLIHQLFLHETAVAVFVTNPQLDDPFKQVAEWSKILNTAMRRATHVPGRLLVAARSDVGGMRVSTEKIDRFLREENFNGYLLTSAKTGENCSDRIANGRPSKLKSLIASSIPWNNLPFIATDSLIRELKNSLLDRASGSKADAVVRFSELLQQLRQSLPTEDFSEEDVRKAVRLLGNQNVILPLDFGDLVLLRPEIMNNYAAAVIQAARNHTDEIGCVSEKDVLEGMIPLSGVERLRRADEQLLLRALVQMLLDRSLCFAEETQGGRQLIFPSQYRRDRPLTEYPEVDVTYTFAGDLAVIFTTLVVRLWLGKIFKNKEIWQNAAEFRTPGGTTIGFLQEKLADGSGKVHVFSDPNISAETKGIFVGLVNEHLSRNATEVVRERRYVCPNAKCRRPITDQKAIEHHLQRNTGFIRCIFCDKKVPLRDAIEEQWANANVVRKIQQADERASIVQDNQSREQLLIGHMMAIAAEANQIYRPVTMFDYGIDGEVEFKGTTGDASGRKIYVQLKSGDSYLRERQRDGMLVFDVQNERHLDYWVKQPCDVYLVIRQSTGEILWMNVTNYLRHRRDTNSRQIIFNGEPLNAFTLMRLRERLVPLGPKQPT